MNTENRVFNPTRLTVLYDGECSLCRKVRQWLRHQTQWVPLELVPLQKGPERFPALAGEDLTTQLVVVGDDRWVYRGDKAWLMILWALADYRQTGMNLSQPALRGMARKAVHWIADHRHAIGQSAVGRYLTKGSINPLPMKPPTPPVSPSVSYRELPDLDLR